MALLSGFNNVGKPLKYFTLASIWNIFSVESIVYALQNKTVMIKGTKVICSEEIHWSRQSFYHAASIGSSMSRVCFYFAFIFVSEYLDCSDSFRRGLVPFFWFITHAAGSVDV